MSAKFFIDTNVLIYAVDAADKRKQAIALQWLAEAHETDAGIVSYQVVQEWFNVVLRKAAVPMSLQMARSIYERLIQPLWRVQSSRELLEAALDMQQLEFLSWWDSLIVSAAIQGGCSQLLTEDLQHGRTIRTVKITNPFQP